MLWARSFRLQTRTLNHRTDLVIQHSVPGLFEGIVDRGQYGDLIPAVSTEILQHGVSFSLTWVF